MSATPNKSEVATNETAIHQDDSDSEIIYPVVLIGNTMRTITQQTLLLIQKYPDYFDLLGGPFVELNYVVIYMFDDLKKYEQCDVNYLNEHLASYAALVAYIAIFQIMLFHVKNIMSMNRAEYKEISQRLNEHIGRISAQVEANIMKTGRLGVYLQRTVNNSVPNLKLVEEYGLQFQSIMTELNDCGDELIGMKPEFGDGIGFIEVFSSLLNSGKIGSVGGVIGIAQSAPFAFTFFSQLGEICNIASEFSDVIHVAHAAHKLWDAFIDPKDYESYLQNTSVLQPHLSSNIASLKRVKETYVDKGNMHGIKEETQNLQPESHPVP